MNPIRVLIVEDSPVIQDFLKHIFNSDQGIRVVGTAANGAEAVEAVKTLRPSVVTMDINMPVMDGLEATRRIMEIAPTPIVIVSGNTIARELSFTFRALEAGALQVVLRPSFGDLSGRCSAIQDLINTVRLMSEIKVVRRTNHPDPNHSGLGHPQDNMSTRPTDIQVVAIGASTGGPLVLRDILAKLPAAYPLPILIVQHIARGFIRGFAEWLSRASGFPVTIAAHGVRILPGQAYLAPDEFHMGVSDDFRIVLSEETKPNYRPCPSVAHLFRSVAAAFGSKSAGVLLTGMGSDGAAELKMMMDMGALTIAQDAASSIVHGMPGEAIKLHAAACILPPGEIADLLSKLPANKKEAAS